MAKGKGAPRKGCPKDSVPESATNKIKSIIKSQRRKSKRGVDKFCTS